MRDEGLCSFYSLTNTAENGKLPKEKLFSLNLTAFYANRTIGQQRLFLAQGAHHKLDRLIRCYMTELPPAAKYVILEDGNQYLVNDATVIVDEDALDLSLERLGSNYEVIDNTNSQS